MFFLFYNNNHLHNIINIIIYFFLIRTQTNPIQRLIKEKLDQMNFHLQENNVKFVCACVRQWKVSANWILTKQRERLASLTIIQYKNMNGNTFYGSESCQKCEGISFQNGWILNQQVKPKEKTKQKVSYNFLYFIYFTFFFSIKLH